MPLPRYVEQSVPYQLYKYCICGYAMEHCKVTTEFKDCPLCGKSLIVKRVDYPRQASPTKF